jgi:hypothetical protein
VRQPQHDELVFLAPNFAGAPRSGARWPGALGSGCTWNASVAGLKCTSALAKSLSHTCHARRHTRRRPWAGPGSRQFARRRWRAARPNCPAFHPLTHSKPREVTRRRALGSGGRFGTVAAAGWPITRSCRPRAAKSGQVSVRRWLRARRVKTRPRLALIALYAVWPVTDTWGSNAAVLSWHCCPAGKVTALVTGRPGHGIQPAVEIQRRQALLMTPCGWSPAQRVAAWRPWPG